MASSAEHKRLEVSNRRETNWKRWGPYLSERQWGTVREDYSENQRCLELLSHMTMPVAGPIAGAKMDCWASAIAMSPVFRLRLLEWQDPILKERLFGLTGPEGNHGEDVKECYYYLDSTPTHSYMKALYKYPQQAFPYWTWSKPIVNVRGTNWSTNWKIAEFSTMRNISTAVSNTQRNQPTTFSFGPQ